MKKESKRYFFAAAGFLLAFALWTLLLGIVDVQAIGPSGSRVGFATLNGAFHELTGVHMTLYMLTDWLGLVPIGAALAFAMLGLAQWIKRKSFFSVDKSILALGGFYLVVMSAYVLFEFVVINRRPVLIEGYLEASYPSSTTLLVLCVMPTAMMELYGRIRNRAFRYAALLSIAAFTLFTVIGRVLSGVHWLTDILGGLLLSAGLVTAHCAALFLVCAKKSPETV